MSKTFEIVLHASPTKLAEIVIEHGNLVQRIESIGDGRKRRVPSPQTVTSSQKSHKRRTRATVTNSMAEKILKARGTNREIGERFHVSSTTVGRIKSGKWKPGVKN